MLLHLLLLLQWLLLVLRMAVWAVVLLLPGAHSWGVQRQAWWVVGRVGHQLSVWLSCH